MRSVRRRSAPRRLASDTRGAIMLAGVFMSVFLVGMLYYLLGVADSIVLEERLQDAADVGAFEASVTMARAMNFVALINTTMLSLTASLMSGNLLVIAGLVCVETNALPEGGCDPFLAEMRAIEEEITPPLLDALRASTAAAEDIVLSTPGVAADRVARRLREEHDDLVLAGFMVPHQMPLERAGMGPLCALANLYQFRLVEITIGRGLMEELIGRLYPRVGRRLPQCEEVSGAGAIVATPPDLPVGSEPYQVRVVVVGDTRMVRAFGRGVRIGPAVLGVPASTDNTRTWVEDRDPDRILVMTQAEYVSDWELANLTRDSPTESIEEEAFRMRWRGRLRRLRFPTGADLDDPSSVAWRDRWIVDELFPACGGACRGLEHAARQATISLH